MGSTILGFGHHVPERRVGNAELESRFGLEAGWIERRTGIVERRWVGDDEAVSDIAVRAGAQALAESGVEPEAVSLVILATSTPDHLLPPTAPLVAHRLGLGGAGAIDMAGACAGFLYALTFADAFARVHGAPVLVIAANILSKRINFEEQDTAVVGPTAREEAGALGVTLESDGAHYDLIKIPAGGSRRPFAEDVPVSETRMTMSNGRAVFNRAVDMMAYASLATLEVAGSAIDEVTHWVPHQANSRIISAAQDRLDIDDARVLTSVREFGNSSAATIPFTMSLHRKRLKQGDLLLLTAVGAGLTGGAVLYRL